MLDESQAQEVGSEAIAIQAGGSVTLNVGISYSDARAIALEVAKSTFQELTGKARQTMSDRVEEITDKVIEKLQNDYPQGLAQATEPDFQHALLTVQKEYGRTGDKDLGDLLIDLLIDRSKQEQRSIMQIVLNESLVTAPKLTEGQLANLAIIFLLRYSRYLRAGNHDLFGVFLDKSIQPFVAKLVRNAASFQHLEFAGCGSVQMGQISLENVIKSSYGGLFCNGFDDAEVSNRGITIGLDKRLFIPCLTDPTKWQVGALENEVLEQKLKMIGARADDSAKIKDLFNHSLMAGAQLRGKIEELRPYMKEVFECWSGSAMKSFNLTSVGIAIGHANVKRMAGECGDLSIWIN